VTNLPFASWFFFAGAIAAAGGGHFTKLRFASLHDDARADGENETFDRLFAKGPERVCDGAGAGRKPGHQSHDAFSPTPICSSWICRVLPKICQIEIGQDWTIDREDLLSKRVCRVHGGKGLTVPAGEWNGNWKRGGDSGKAL
jgi:hypothetical protein